MTHKIKALHHILTKLHLTAGALKVMARVRGLEVGIAAEIVGEEACAELKCEGRSAECEVLFLRLGHYLLARTDKAARKRLKVFEIQADLTQIGLILGRKVRRAADSVTVVVRSKTGHDGIKVDYHHGVEGITIEEDVIALCIVVSDAHGYSAVVAQTLQSREVLAVILEEDDILFAFRGSALGVCGGSVEQGLNTPAPCAPLHARPLSCRKRSNARQTR